MVISIVYTTLAELSSLGSLEPEFTLNLASLATFHEYVGQPDAREAESKAAPSTRRTARYFFHILGSKLNGSERPITIRANSRCLGFSTKLRSWGTTTEGTERTTVLDGGTIARQ